MMRIPMLLKPTVAWLVLQAGELRVDFLELLLAAVLRAEGLQAECAEGVRVAEKRGSDGG